MKQLKSASAPAAARIGGCYSFVLAGLLFLVSGGISAAAESASTEWVRDNESAVRMVSTVAGAGTESELRTGIEFELQPGWKTYWRTPGDAGYPVTVDWQGSVNVAAADIAWPAPHRFTLFGLDTFGYSEAVLLPVMVKPQRAGEAVSLRAAVSYLVCEEICIPKTASLALDIPAGAATPSEFAQLVARYQAQVPGDGARHGLYVDSAVLGGSAGKQTLEIAARSAPLPFEHPDVIVEGPDGFAFGAPEIALSADGAAASFSLPVIVNAGIDAGSLAKSNVTLTLFDGQRGLEQKITLSGATLATAIPATTSSQTSSLPIILIALLGGLVLNFMPCVLPVLSLKMLGLVGHAGERAATRRGFLASSAGIVTAFVILAAALVAVKQAGGVIGWGIQFQHPWFLVAMTLVLVLFAANLLGWFELPLPAWIGRIAGAEHGNGLVGQFFTGMLATLLATPCSAPFVGTAVTFAFSRGAGEIFMIFAALGIGLALPYLLVAAFPGLGNLLPRPGVWMIWLRRILGLLLTGTAVWLITIVAAQLSEFALALAVAGIVMLALFLALQGRLPSRGRIAGSVLGATIAMASVFLPGTSRGPVAAIDDVWQPFAQTEIDGLVQSGKTVFVDVTADWCVTCIVNKQLVLDVGASAERLRRPEVVPMKADWTKPDESIARYLASFGRYGIPFNVVYGPAAPGGILLPELLNESAVVDAFNRASGG
ncbi:MAG: protein-disulfide reductase DsbD family protein [Dongiaceae bacterium]